MRVRILTIKGPTKAARQARLAAAREWMEAHGWELGDFDPGLGSALFERREGAGPVKWNDPTRWLPPPGWFRPREWMGALAARPRQLALGGGVGVVVLAGFVAVLSSTSFSDGPAPPGVHVREGQEVWLYVHADALNVRAEPEGGSQIVGVLYRNQKVLVAGQKGEWLRLAAPERGFAAARFLADHPAPQ